jgi:hypothetical protein
MAQGKCARTYDSAISGQAQWLSHVSCDQVAVNTFALGDAQHVFRQIKRINRPNADSGGRRISDQ